MTDSAGLAGLDWIAVDWGTSSLRIWAIGADGGVLARAASEDGMGRLTPADYEPVFLKLAGGWLPGAPGTPVPVIVCGMAGARQGWKEAPYRTVPCAPVRDRLTDVATADPRIEVAIVPGLCQDAPADVMRGEETQIAGLAARPGGADAIACLPGTHSKWVRIAKGEAVSFRTFMTGELFALLAGQSVLRHSVAAEGGDDEAFRSAVDEMLAAPEALTASLFSVRAGALLKGTSHAAGRSRLSGLLIGAELAAMRDTLAGREVHLIGAGGLVAAYAAALRQAGLAPVAEDAEALTLAGLKAARGAMREQVS